ncbi:MAG: hypothetical protein QF921_11405 [Pseudomonadales bacterium]|jgi:hypothetical protein|nr:hypothetical protein [Pseudomonadales bacterium]MDP6470694.1 hypothetical protein [Pseudomonadales bacterium]MDP6828354.1 hypothetical protein [Pseudomonadales bacterium]MDP6972096.1 hypothetical protein [Pseudomonadales bacterium]|tara:strand:- start:1648 stop:1890 length:243 start_codon:yes stop_codon:yes gene_type:complete
MATRVLNQGAVLVLIVLSLPIAMYAFFSGFGGDVGSDIVARLQRLPFFGALHMFGGGVALLIGGFQFSSKIRSRQPVIHR